MLTLGKWIIWETSLGQFISQMNLLILLAVQKLVARAQQWLFTLVQCTAGPAQPLPFFVPSELRIFYWEEEFPASSR